MADTPSTMKKVIYSINSEVFLTLVAPFAKEAIVRNLEPHLVLPETSPELLEKRKRELNLFRSVQFIPLHRSSLSIGSNLRTWRAFQAAYERIEPDLIHHFTLKPILMGSLAARKLDKPPRIVNTFTGLGYVFTNQPGVKRRVLRGTLTAIFRWILRKRNQRLVFLNSDDLEVFRNLIPECSDRMRLIPGTGTPASEYVPPVHKSENPTPIVLYAGRMLIDKGLFELIEAARLLRKKNVAHELVLAGPLDPDNPANISETTIRAWESEGLCRWLGPVHPLLPVYQKSDVFCLPSYREGMPRVNLEASLCELPVVATCVPGSRETVIDGKTGYLVPSHDAHSLAHALETLLTNRELRDQMGKAGREFCRANFDITVVVQRIFEIYQELAEEHS